MILKFLVLIGMIAFCIWQFIQEISTPGPVYIPVIYIICPVLLLIGLGPRGVITWPLATILLLLERHWIVGFIPAALVGFTIVGNEWLKKKYPTKCQVCNNNFEEGQEVINYRGVHVHAGDCFDELISRTGDDSDTELGN